MRDNLFQATVRDKAESRLRSGRHCEFAIGIRCKLERMTLSNPKGANKTHQTYRRILLVRRDLTGVAEFSPGPSTLRKPSNRADAETLGGQKHATMKNHASVGADFDRKLKQPTTTMRRSIITSGTVAMRSGVPFHAGDEGALQ